jgi:hypothetical protein
MGAQLAGKRNMASRGGADDMNTLHTNIAARLQDLNKAAWGLLRVQPEIEFWLDPNRPFDLQAVPSLVNPRRTTHCWYMPPVGIQVVDSHFDRKFVYELHWDWGGVARWLFQHSQQRLTVAGTSLRSISTGPTPLCVLSRTTRPVQPNRLCITWDLRA